MRREGRGGGVVESKKRIEQWRESMFPMRSIELSIILLQPVDGSSRDEEGSEEGRKRREQTSVRGRWGGQVAPLSAVSTRSAECDGELCVAMQIYCPVCLAAPAAEDKNRRHRRGREKQADGERDGGGQRQNGNETQKKKENERTEQREGGKRERQRQQEGKKGRF